MSKTEILENYSWNRKCIKIQCTFRNLDPTLQRQKYSQNSLLKPQRVKGSGAPWYPGKHEQIALWLMALHSALTPQIPGKQGVLHFWLMQAKFCWHSELTKHSGRQFGGSPM